MRIGIVGLREGHVSGMLSSARKSANAELVGVVESDDNLYEALIGSKGLCVPRYPTLVDMLSEAQPELLIEGVHHAAKVELVEMAAQAGAHVLLDKPLCRNLADWERMRAAVEESGIKLSMWFTSRSYPPFMALREHLLAGDLGEIVSAVSTHPHKLWDKAPRWYWDKDIYAGTFFDLGCHGVDQIRWLTGAEYTGVHAISTCIKHTDPPLVDHVQASFRLSNGACGVVTADWLTPQASPTWGDTRFIVMGTEGSAHLRAYAGNHLLVVSNKKGVIEPTFDQYKPAPFVQEMISAYERGDENFISTQDVFAVARACIAAEESARQGGAWVSLE